MRPSREVVVNFIKKWRMEWAVLTVLTYLVAIVLVIIVFPDISNTWVSVFILASGFTAAMTSLADLLVGADTHDEVEDDDMRP